LDIGKSMRYNASYRIINMWSNNWAKEKDIIVLGIGYLIVV